MKKHTATLSSKGQIVLPREVRERLGVQMGDEVDFILDDAGIHVAPHHEAPNPFTAWIGAALSEASNADVEAQGRHAGLSDEELTLLRAGPGAQVRQLGLVPDAE